MFAASDSNRNPSTKSATDDAIDRITREVRAGLKHGYFELRVESSIVQNGRRELTVHSGKTYLYHIPREEALEAFGDPR
jgi:hypothetical protein